MTSLVCLYPLSKFLWESAQGGVIQLRVAFQAIDALCQTSQRLGGFGKFWSQMAGNPTKTTMASGTGSYFSLFFVENSCVTCFLSSYINAILSKHFATWVGDWGMIIPQRHSNYYYWEKHKGSSNRESKGVVITGNVTGVTVSVLMIHDHPNRLHTGSPLAKPVQFSKKTKVKSTFHNLKPFYVVLINLCTLLHNDRQSPVETRHLPANVDVSSRFHISFIMFHTRKCCQKQPQLLQFGSFCTLLHLFFPEPKLIFSLAIWKWITLYQNAL